MSDHKIKNILVLGSGAIIVGQGGEFDYSGTQAIKGLKEIGLKVILVNPNPATIMTDPDLADVVYLEPLHYSSLEQIIKKEKPDAVLPTVGGQTALNCLMSLVEKGILEKYGVEIIGVTTEAIQKSEDRQQFSRIISQIGLSSPENAVVTNLEDGINKLDYVGLPAIIRPSFTLGGLGGGIAHTKEEFVEIASEGLRISPIKQIEITRSVIGWKEYELEVIKDIKGNCIVVCAIENFDPMGIHTGDSITIAPTITLRDQEYQKMRDAAFLIVKEIGLLGGGANVQFAVKNSEMLVIEMNPRVSRSSALASKATGYPIAKISAKLSMGYTLNELKNDCAFNITAGFEPSIDYITTKIPRFDFNKFHIKKPQLTSAMQSVGEIMSIGRSFHESIQKALCSLEEEKNGFKSTNIEPDKVLEELKKNSPEKILIIADALRYGFSVEEITKITQHNPWFIECIKEIIAQEHELIQLGFPNDPIKILKIKKMGFSDSRIAFLTNSTEEKIRKLRKQLMIKPVFKKIDTCAAEFPTKNSYMYQSYEGDGINYPECESGVTLKKKVAVIGSGPNRIGQGIEFDWACVHALSTIQKMGYESIMINCNPETVSTDYDSSNRLYFSPLTHEHVLDILELENSENNLIGVLIQLGGQTPIKLAKELTKSGINILGTSFDSIDIAEDRKRFNSLMKELNIKQPKAQIYYEAQDIMNRNDNFFPIVIRPSYVLGGKNMAIIHSQDELKKYIEYNKFEPLSSILIDEYLTDAIEIDVDAICDRNDVYIAGIIEHIEEAGIHSGDSATVIPVQNVSQKNIDIIKKHTTNICIQLKILGMINIQFAIQNDEVYILEVNPRASRTLPFVSKATGIPVPDIATQIILGKKLNQFNLPSDCQIPGIVAVKCPVFSFASFANVDTILGPEMKSTGEVMGIDIDFPKAFAKAQMSSSSGGLPSVGTAILSIKDRDKNKIKNIATQLIEMGFCIVATKGTAEYLQKYGIHAKVVNKVREGGEHIVKYIYNTPNVTFIVNTTEGARSIQDSVTIRRASLIRKIPCALTINAAQAILGATKSLCNDKALAISLNSITKKQNIEI